MESQLVPPLACVTQLLTTSFHLPAETHLFPFVQRPTWLPSVDLGRERVLVLHRVTFLSLLIWVPSATPAPGVEWSLFEQLPPDFALNCGCEGSVLELEAGFNVAPPPGCAAGPSLLHLSFLACK